MRNAWGTSGTKRFTVYLWSWDPYEWYRVIEGTLDFNATGECPDTKDFYVDEAQK